MGNSRARIRAQEEETRRHNASLAQQDRNAQRAANERQAQRRAVAKKRADDERIERNRQAHEKEMERVRNANEKQKREHEKRLQDDKLAHEKRMAELKIQQKKEAVNQMTTEINKLDGLINADRYSLEQDTRALQKETDLCKKEEEWISNFKSYKQTQLDIEADNLDLTKAKDAFLFADQQVKKAIHETGQVEENVGKFLTLTSGLMDATIATTANTNKLDVEISTFGELISRECQDKLYVEEYFIQQNLQKFVPFLQEEEFVYLDHLICSNDEEYQEIMEILEKGMRQQLALEAAPAASNEAEEQKEELEGEELAKQLLTSWGLQQCFDAMMEDGWDDPIGWKDLEDDDLKEIIPKKGQRNKFKRKYEEWMKSRGGQSEDKLFKARERRMIKEICLQPQSWQKYQAEKVEGIREALAVVCPLFCEFFSTIHTGIKQSQELLGYDLSLNAQQMKAIEMVHDMPPPKAIEYKQNDDDNDNDNTDEGDEKAPDVEVDFDDMYEAENKLRKQWQINSKCQIYSESNGKWCDGTIIDITNDAEGEWLHVKYRTNQRESAFNTKEIQRGSKSLRPVADQDANSIISEQCRALKVASIVSIDVTTSMMHKFEANDLTLRALTVATGVEDCCMQIIKSQATIRQSVLLAKEILNWKPAHMDEDAKKYWAVIDRGVNQIFVSAIEMVRTSAQYFAFFLRFKQSFNYYLCNQDKSLVVSLEYLHKDIREFTVFKQQFAKRVQQLTHVAMESVKQCVEQHIGAKNFAEARNARESTLKKWLEKKAIYDKRSIELDQELDKHQQDRIQYNTEKARLQYRVNMLNSQIKVNLQYKQRYSTERASLQSQI